MKNLSNVHELDLTVTFCHISKNILRNIDNLCWLRSATLLFQLTSSHDNLCFIGTTDNLTKSRYAMKYTNKFCRTGGFSYKIVKYVNECQQFCDEASTCLGFQFASKWKVNCYIFRKICKDATKVVGCSIYLNRI